MATLTKPIAHTIRLPRLTFPRLFGDSARRRATIDLIHSSPHLLRDIGAMEGQFSNRGR